MIFLFNNSPISQNKKILKHLYLIFNILKIKLDKNNLNLKLKEVQKLINNKKLTEDKKKDKIEDSIKEYNAKITNRFNQTFEEVIKLYVNKRHLESLEKLKDFRLIKDKNYNLSDDWLGGFENNIRENAKNFLEIFKEKELEKEINNSKEIEEKKEEKLIP